MFINLKGEENMSKIYGQIIVIARCLNSILFLI